MATINKELFYSFRFLIPLGILCIFIVLKRYNQIEFFIPILILLNFSNVIFGEFNQKQFFALHNFISHGSCYKRLIWLYFVALLGFNIYFIITVLPTLQNFDLKYFSLLISYIVVNSSFTIAIGHELCHSSGFWSKIAANILFSICALPCFLSNHIFSHHTWVSTANDPTSAKKNQHFYSYIFNTTLFKIKASLTKQYYPKHFLDNMLKLSLTSLYFILIIILIKPSSQLIIFVAFYIISMYLMYEMVSYIQHYGLTRKVNSNQNFEPTNFNHSWNNLYKYTNYFLFTLPIHSFHHTYELNLPLEKAYSAPKLPYSFFSMMICSFLPPLFFGIMNKHLSYYLNNED